jgi:excinuclease ABC subunit A
MPAFIDARGVRVHNLKGVNVRIPTGSLVVVTGVSGSGKSSLAFDTLYAEGQRRYVESLSVYARQFLERMEKPAVEAIDGICPAIAIRQRAPSRNPRSTVATATEIHDHLRLLFGRIGRTYCDSCGQEVTKDSVEGAVRRLVGLPEGSRALVAFPWSPEGTPLPEALDRLRQRGYRRVLAGERLFTLEDEGTPEGLDEGPFAVVLDRVTMGSDTASRLAQSLESAFAEGGGRAFVQVQDGETFRFSDRFECARCGREFVQPQPRLFSFNSPYGACPVCHGFGNLIEVDTDLVVPDKSRSLAKGAIEPWNKPHYKGLLAELKRFARRRGIPLDRPWSDLDEAHRRAVFEGDEEFQGVLGFFRWLEAKKYKVQVRVFLSRYRGYQECHACGGSRLRPEALRVRVGGRNLQEVCALPVREARAYLEGLVLEGETASVAAKVVTELSRRLRLLAEVGLDYLSLDRPFGTLSGGEAQRIALATAVGTGLRGTLYVLDEPSVGLHPRDTQRLIGILNALRDQGNTVLVVEHDPALVRAADHVIDLGPGAGEQGGRVVFQGTLAELLEDPRSLTAKYLRGELRIAVPTKRRRGNGLLLKVKGARAHNLKGVDVKVPLGAMTCVTGVSGSGKSSLVHDVIATGLQRRRNGADAALPGVLEGAEFVDEVEIVDQSPIGRSPRSNPVTYIKAFDAIRDVFAATKDARRLGLTAGDFSFNVPGGRCEACSGDGQVRVDLQFLADVYLVCEVCRGRRYSPPLLEVRYHGKTIDEVLNLTVHEALHFFGGQTRVTRRLKVFEQIGLGYLRLGQSAATLSGGEAQRVKLAAHLLRKPGPRVLYILDEPTTGLHLGDVSELMDCFDRLLEGGATLLVIEHHLDVIKRADWVIDLGPEGGEEGGAVVFEGTPEGLAESGRGVTAPCLREVLRTSLLAQKLRA